MTFAADVAVSILDKLEIVYVEASQPVDLLLALRGVPECLLLRAAGAGAKALEAAGGAVADSDGDLGPAVLDAQHALAQESFRRFAVEVVGRQAEHIHRQDLTVPDALLQPMREMGLFGLAIPVALVAVMDDIWVCARPMPY